MKKHHLCLLAFILASMCTHDLVAAQKLRLSFAQIAVGDQWTTIIDLNNMGSQTFNGLLQIGDSYGNYLPVYVNSIRVAGDYSLSIPPSASRRLTLTSSGATSAGNVQIYGNEDYNEQINGTVIYQFRRGSELWDSVGVLPSKQQLYFYFFTEYTDSIWTGLALAEALGNSASITLTAISENGVQVDQESMVLNPLCHTAFFVHERLSLPKGFRGRVEVRTSNPISATALRSENDQFSTISATPIPCAYTATIQLNDGRRFTADSILEWEDNYLQMRWFWASPQEDAGHIGWERYGSMYSLAGNRTILLSPSGVLGGKGSTANINASLSEDWSTFSGAVYWEESTLTGQKITNGSISASRRR